MLGLNSRRALRLLPLAVVAVLGSTPAEVAGAIPPRSTPKVTIDLSSVAAYPLDVTWMTTDEVLVSFASATWKVSLKGGKPQLIDSSVRVPEIVASDGKTVLVSGASANNFAHLVMASAPKVVRKGIVTDFYPRDAAVLHGQIFYLGWRSRPPNEEETRGVLWRLGAGGTEVTGPLHQIQGDEDAVKRWRLTSSPYAGAIVAERGGTLAVMTEAEPGIHRYSADGKLVKRIGADLGELVLDTSALTAKYAGREDLRARYEKLINLQPTVEDLVSTPNGLAVLVRTAAAGKISWQLWYVEKPGHPRTLLSQGRAGPMGHMRCEARDWRMACVGSFPEKDSGPDLSMSIDRPLLLIYDLK